MVAATSAVTLLCCVVLAQRDLAYHSAPAISRRLCGHPAAGLPVGDQPMGLRGSPRSADHGGALRAAARRSWKGPPRCRTCCCRPSAPARTCQGLLLGLGVLMAVSLTTLSNPHTDHALAAAPAGFGFSAGFLMLRRPLLRGPLAVDHLGR